MKKYLLSIIISIFALTAVAFAADGALFPASNTGEDGITRWGYLDENGVQQVGYFYAKAEPFNEYGLAVVENTQGQTSVIDHTGKVVIECNETPRAIEFAQGVIALRYAEQSVYYDAAGQQTGTYRGAAGFFESGLLRVQQGERWGYVNAAGEFQIPAEYIEAGDFQDGRALVRDADGTYSMLLTSGIRMGLPGEPAALVISPNSLIVLRAEEGFCLYSLATGSYLSETYDQMQVHDDGYVSVQRDKKWGILSASGKVSVPLEYYYLSYMGEGAYVARGAEGTAVLAIDGSGTLIYATDTYVGGFETFRFGQSWHGTMDGGVMFFNKNGVLSRKIDGASNPEILSGDVVRVTVGGEQKYIRLSDGKVLYAPVRAYALDNGTKVTTKLYEKYLGMRDGVEYGWRLEYPRFSGMKDTAVQQKINSAIEKFFLDGPNVPAQKESLVGGYGFAFYGRVLVVYADAKLGTGEGATLWNDNIALDFGTGAKYTVSEDLFGIRYEDAVIAAMPEGAPLDAYQYPRMTADGVIYYLNTPQTAHTPAAAKEHKIYFSSLWDVIDTEGDCYRALINAAPSVSEKPNEAPIAVSFADVPASHWAYAFIKQVAEKRLMTGADGLFRPNDSIAASEAIVVLSRSLALPEGIAPGVAPTAWYAGEYGGAYEAGILAGLTDLQPDAMLTRADAMQLFANTLRQSQVAQALPSVEVESILRPFADAPELLPDRREAAAWCVKNGVFSGAGGNLQPNSTLTRAEFAKLLSAI